MKVILQTLFLIAFIINTGAAEMIKPAVKSLYMPEERIAFLDDEVSFWSSRVHADPHNASYKSKLGAALTSRFAVSGEIDDLRAAENHIAGSLEYAVVGRSGLYRQLARNYISQHRFCEALDALNEAAVLGADYRQTQLMLVDVYQELGDDKYAGKLLQGLSGTRDFNYLVRKAKLADKAGDLDGAIAFLEEALDLAERSGHRENMAWSYSNIADFYGHAGLLEKSRDHYIKALEINAADWYSLKGLAWMAYSKDDHPELALAILDIADLYSSSPAIDILQIEILEYMGRNETAREKSEQVFDMVRAYNYGHMYNGYIHEYYLESGVYDKAMRIAEEEGQQRQTPDVHIMMFKTRMALGMTDEAARICYSKILGKTFEPGLLLSVIDAVERDSKEFKELQAELEGARYELGPVDYAKFLEKAG